jgi:hypothetical protein
MLQTIPDVRPWLTAKESDVLDQFHGLTNAFSDGEGCERFVYIPGTRKDRVLLVAHADTVWGNLEVQLTEKDGVISSAREKEEIKVKRGDKRWIQNGIGIGADCRAGCAIIWGLRDLGHSILITSGEEIGGLGAKRIIGTDWWKEEIDKHQFAVEFDRMNEKDIVFYDVGTKGFAEYVTKETQYKPARGTYTDIVDLCKTICGVNISIGYYDQHRPSEKLVLKEWRQTFNIVHEWLSKNDIPKFAFDPKDWQNKFFLSDLRIKNTAYTCDDAYYHRAHSSKHFSNYNPSYSLIPCTQADGTLKCPYCHTVLSDVQWFANMFKCTSCQKEI